MKTLAVEERTIIEKYWWLKCQKIIIFKNKIYYIKFKFVGILFILGVTRISAQSFPLVLCPGIIPCGVQRTMFWLENRGSLARQKPCLLYYL